MTRTWLSLQFAIRFVFPRKGSVKLLSSFVSITTMALGVAVLVIGLSAVNGFEYELKKRILSLIPHGEIRPLSAYFVNISDMLKRIEKVPGVIAAAPFLSFPALLESNNRLQIVQARGIDPTLEKKISTLPQYLINSTWSSLQTGHHTIFIGKSVAHKLNVKLGDWLTMMIVSNSLKSKSLQPKYINLKVGGVLALHSQIENNLAIVPLVDARHYLDLDRDAGSIAIKTNNIFHSDKILQTAGKATCDYVEIYSWVNTYSYIYRDIQIVRFIIYVSMALIIGIACFNIITVLLITFKDKNIDIAVLRTLGAGDRLIRFIFTWYGFIIGAIGCLAGMVIGIIVTLNLTSILKRIEHLLGVKFFSKEIYFIDFLPTRVCWRDIISVLMLALLISLISSWGSSRRMIYTYPVQVLSSK